MKKPFRVERCLSDNKNLCSAPSSGSLSAPERMLIEIRAVEASIMQGSDGTLLRQAFRKV